MVKFKSPKRSPQGTLLFQLDGTVFNCYHKYSVLLQPLRNSLDV